MGEKPIKMDIINDKMFGIYSEDNDDSQKSFKQGDHIGPLERSLGQQCR